MTRLELQAEFERLKRRLGKTMLLVTHDLDEAFRLADRIAVMKDGRVLQFAIVAVSGVVVYSAILLMRFDGAM